VLVICILLYNLKGEKFGCKAFIVVTMGSVGVLQLHNRNKSHDLEQSNIIFYASPPLLEILVNFCCY
jgi:hypothetical protein